jgi:flavorubredoxin
MKVLIVYDSVSPSKMTKAVALTIGEGLREKGIEADTLYFAEVDKSAIKNYDCMIAGGPTMAFRPSKGIAQFLDSLPSNDFKGRRAAAFDTQLKMAISGDASKGIEKKLKSLGFAIFKPPLPVYVEGPRKNMYQFKAGELEKVKNWAQEAASALSANL